MSTLIQSIAGYGHPVTVVQAPPPPPHAISDASVTHFLDSGGVVLYHVSQSVIAARQRAVFSHAFFIYCFVHPIVLSFVVRL